MLHNNYRIDIKRKLREWSPTNFLLDLKYSSKEKHLKQKEKREDKFQATIDAFISSD